MARTLMAEMRAGVYLTDGTSLYEIREVLNSPMRARVVDCSWPVPTDRVNDEMEGAWISLVELRCLQRVLPAGEPVPV